MGSSPSAHVVRLPGVMEPIEIRVKGTPQPGGSKTAIPIPNRRWKKGMPIVLKFLHDMKTGRPIVNVVDDNRKAAGWKKTVATAAEMQYGNEPLDRPLLVEMTFYVTRNQGDYGTGRNARILKASARAFPHVRPDVLKLARPVEDALTGIVWVDDGRTVDLLCRKRFADDEHAEGVLIRVLPHAHSTIGEAAEAAQQTLEVSA